MCRCPWRLVSSDSYEESVVSSHLWSVILLFFSTRLWMASIFSHLWCWMWIDKGRGHLPKPSLTCWYSYPNIKLNWLFINIVWWLTLQDKIFDLFSVLFISMQSTSGLKSVEELSVSHLTETCQIVKDDSTRSGQCWYLFTITYICHAQYILKFHYIHVHIPLCYGNERNMWATLKFCDKFFRCWDRWGS